MGRFGTDAVSVALLVKWCVIWFICSQQTSTLFFFFLAEGIVNGTCWQRMKGAAHGWRCVSCISGADGCACTVQYLYTFFLQWSVSGSRKILSREAIPFSFLLNSVYWSTYARISKGPQFSSYHAPVCHW